MTLSLGWDAAAAPRAQWGDSREAPGEPQGQFGTQDKGRATQTWGLALARGARLPAHSAVTRVPAKRDRVTCSEPCPTLLGTPLLAKPAGSASVVRATDSEGQEEGAAFACHPGSEDSDSNKR